jgi:tetratricopeptide (TPR) repeat protein
MMRTVHVVLGICIASLSCAAEAVAQPSAAPPPAQGKIVALNGRVEHTPAAREDWNAARMFQPLLTAERVRTLAASRASILFIDETQVKLNAGAVLVVHEVRSAGGAATSLELTRGEGWFRTKNPQSGLTIKTPAAAAAVRGTEINLRIAPDDTTVLTVVEGTAEFSNPQGSLLVTAGEEATAIPGQAPTKRVVLNPEDAVQWALYYPAQVAWSDLPGAATAGPGTATAGPGSAGFERLRSGDSTAALQIFEAAPPTDAWSRVGASMAYLAINDTDRARAAVADPTTGDAEIERRAQLAAVLLATGDTTAARRELEAALAQDANAVRPLILLSSIELRQNKPDAARAAADRALTAHPQSVGALIAASEAAQSQFDLQGARGYLDRAITIDPRDVHALVNRARIRFGTDDTGGARADMDHAAAIAADDAQVRSLRGFISLAAGDIAQAGADFEAAAQRDAEFGEPHLGLGLVHFRQGRQSDGLLEMLTATLLEPKVALYQSYLGKAYYQAGRLSEGLAALASAKRLDPRDPTPWLYASFYLRDLNQQVAALDELRHAIALNDHRAVYRSRLLLDRDLATKNVSLAEIYRQLGFQAWGAYEALNSLEVDLTNASAHLFLADNYGGLPDRNEALGSELLQYFLYAPVNRNSFNNFSEYTALLEQPRRQLEVTTEAGTRERVFGNVNHRSGNERFAHVAFFQAAREDGFRTNRQDDRLQGFFQGKLSFGSRSDVFFSFSGVRSNEGADDDATAVFGLDTGFPIILRQFTPVPDPTLTNRFWLTETTVGAKHQWRPGSVLTASVRRNDFEQIEERPLATKSLCAGFDLNVFEAHSTGQINSPFNVFEAQVQQATRLGRHQVIIGVQTVSQDKASRCSEVIRIDGTEDTLPVDQNQSGSDSANLTYVRDEIQLARWLHASIGVAYQQVEYDDFVEDQRIERDEWLPRLGVSARISPTTMLRAAAFRSLNSNFFGSNIGPPTVAGFVVARNEFPTARRREYNLSLEQSANRAFLAVRGFYRSTTVPYLVERGSNFIPEADATGTGGSIYLNWIAGKRVTLFADHQMVRLGTGSFDRDDHLSRLGVNLIHPRGVFVRLTGNYVVQRFRHTPVTELPRSSFPIGDLDVSYEFGGKRGLLNLHLSNAFNRRFATIVEGLSIDPFTPRRRAVLSARWRLW